MKDKFAHRGSIDYKYSLELVKQINRFVEETPQIRPYLQHDGFDLWQSFQMALFSDAKRWSEVGELSQIKTIFTTKLKIIISGLGILLISFVSFLIFVLVKKKIAIFTEDKVEDVYRNDSRLSSLYEVLREDRVSFLEVVHTIPRAETFSRFIKRRRPIFFLESIDFLLSPFVHTRRVGVKKLVQEMDFSDFDDKDRGFVKFELEKFLSSLIVYKWRVRMLAFVFRLSGVSTTFSIDDTRYYLEFILASRSLGLPAYAIQHGHFTKYHIGWLKMTNLGLKIIKPDKLLVWSKYWEDELARLGSYFKPEEILVAGGKDIHIKSEVRSTTKIGVLIPYEKDAPKEEVSLFAKKLLKFEDMQVIFKVRDGASSPDEQLKEYGLEDHANKILVMTNTPDALSLAQVVVGTYSTFLYDCVEAKKSVAILETELDYGEGMVRNGLARFIRKDVDIHKEVVLLAGVGQGVLEERFAKLCGSEDKKLSRTLRGIIKHDVSN